MSDYKSEQDVIDQIQGEILSIQDMAMEINSQEFIWERYWILEATINIQRKLTIFDKRNQYYEKFKEIRKKHKEKLKDMK